MATVTFKRMFFIIVIVIGLAVIINILSDIISNYNDDYISDTSEKIEYNDVKEYLSKVDFSSGDNKELFKKGYSKVKIAKELTYVLGQKTLYLLDEPTTGLHYHDISVLLKVLNKLVDKGNTVITIEHNMHMLKSMDYLIDLGPDAGEKGGEIICTGTVKDIINNPNSYTGKFLKLHLEEEGTLSQFL